MTRQLRILLPSALSLLLIPLVAMQFTNEVSWQFADFLVAGALLTAASLALAYVLAKNWSTTQRATLVIGVLMLLLVVWAELAVGIFGSPLAGS